MQQHPKTDHLPELYVLVREYDAALQSATEPEEICRLYRILQELRASIIQIENR